MVADIAALFRSFPWMRPSFSAAALLKITGNVQKSTGKENFKNRLLKAVEFAGVIEVKRGIGKNAPDPFLSNPLKIAERMADYGATETEYLAAILYSSLRSYRDDKADIQFNSSYIEKIDEEFGPEVATLVHTTLQFYETSLLTRPAIPEWPHESPQSEAVRLNNFGHLLDEIRGDNLSVLRIRGAEWIEGLSSLVGIKKGGKLTEAEDIQYVRPAEIIDIPLLGRAYAKAQFTENKMMAQSLIDIHNDIGFLCLQLREPNRFQSIVDLIGDRQSRFLRTSQPGRTIATATGKRAFIGKTLEEDIMEALPEELRPQCRVNVRPEKSALSVQRKFEQKGRLGIPMQKVDTGDIIACTLIVRHPKPDVYLSLERIRSLEYLTPKERSDKVGSAKKEEIPLVRRIVDALSGTFEIVEDRTKDFIDNPTQTYADHPDRKRQDNGYHAIHITIKHRGIQFEIQVKGYAAEYDALFGLASHTAYKGYSSTDDSALIDPGMTVSVWGIDNNLYRLPKGATVTDYLVGLGPHVAFSAQDIVLERNSVFGDVAQPITFDTTLQSNDKLIFSQDMALAFNEQHRQEIIAACYCLESQEILRASERDLGPFQPQAVSAPGEQPSRLNA